MKRDPLALQIATVRSGDAAGTKIASLLTGAGSAPTYSYANNLVTSTGYVIRAVPRDDERYFGITARKEF